MTMIMIITINVAMFDYRILHMLTLLNPDSRFHFTKILLKFYIFFFSIFYFFILLLFTVTISNTHLVFAIIGTIILYQYKFNIIYIPIISYSPHRSN